MRKLVYLIILLILPVWLVAAPGDVRTSIIHINNNTGLSNSAVNAIFQDSEGMMWFGTWDGLNRYDGRSVYRFGNLANDPYSLSHHIIREISEEDSRHLWITTDYGINRLDKVSGRIEKFYLDHKPSYIFQEKSFTCQADGKGTVVASFSGQGLYLYDSRSGEFKKTAIAGCRKPFGIFNLFFDEAGALWAYTNGNSLVKMEIKDGKPQMLHEVKLPSGDVSAPIYDSGKFIWLTIGHRLHKINVYDAKPVITDTEVTVDGNLTAAFSNHKGIIIGTDSGCYRFENGELKLYQNITAPVLSIMEGTQDILWVGTDGKGVLECYSQPAYVSYIDPSRYGSSSNYPVRAILYDDHGMLWIGNKGGGLSQIFHLGAKNLERSVNMNVGAGRTYNSVLSLAKGKNCVWIGTDGNGLLYYDHSAAKIVPLDLSASPEGKGIKSVYCIMQTDSASLYLGTSGNGMFRISLDGGGNARSIENYRHTNSASTSLGSNIVYAMANDGNVIWIGTRGGGLSRFDKKTGRIQTFRAAVGVDGTICSNDVISLLRDSQGRLWVGTTSGVSMLADTRAKRPVFHTYDKNSGLPNTNIHSILEDRDHNIWVSTSHGLARIDSKDSHITSFFYEDGLQDNEFSDGAAFASADGSTLYFGGVNGFNILYPSAVTANNFMPHLILKGVATNNCPYEFADSTLKTTYRANSIHLDFAVTDYVNNEKCQILYRLKSTGLFSRKSSDWVNLGESRTVVLNQLPPGKYILEVKISNARQNDSEPLKLNISISSPIWASWWAILLYILAALAIVVMIFKVKRSRLLIEHELALEKQEKINREETHQAKLRFFTNIAHEFSNSITLIYGAVEQILAKRIPDDSMKRQLLTIQSNAERMSRQIQELMEFRKAEQGYLQVQYERVDIPQLIRSITDNFIDRLDSKGITLKLQLEKSPEYWVVDRNMLEKIVFNLLSNALKYTPENGDVELTVSETADHRLVIRCANSGDGIPENKLQDIFDRFTILDNFERKLSQGKYSRNGIGLALCKDLVTLMDGRIGVESERGVETVFTVEIPAHDESEIADTSSTGPSPSEPSPSIPAVFPDYEMPVAAARHEAEGSDSRFETELRQILVVDDQPEILDMIADILGEKYEILVASNGVEAIEVLESSMPSLIISDIIMPEMNGIELIKQVKTNEKTRYIPVILLSSKSDIESRIEVMETGANLFITKPFHPQYLMAAVDNILQNHAIMKKFSESASAYKEKYNGAVVQKEDKEFIDKVIDVLSQKSSDENYNQDMLAADLNISRIQLYRKIKRIADSTPGDFIRSYRLKRAEQMLLHTDKTIQEIMTECGFHNKAYFYRLFQRYHNCSPRAYRTSRGQAATPPED